MNVHWAKMTAVTNPHHAKISMAVTDAFLLMVLITNLGVTKVLMVSPRLEIIKYVIEYRLNAFLITRSYNIK